MKEKHHFIFLIDGSVGMSAQVGRTDLKKAMTDLSSIDTKSLAGAFTLASGFYGPAAGILWHAPYNLQDPKTLDLLSVGMNSCIYPLYSGTEQMEKAIEEDKRVHLVILSDDRVYDIRRNKVALEKLLKIKTKPTLDVVLIGRKGSRFEDMLGYLKESFPQQVGAVNVRPQNKMSGNMFSKIVSSHMKKGAKGHKL